MLDNLPKDFFGKVEGSSAWKLYLVCILTQFFFLREYPKFVPINNQCSSHIETSQMIYYANQFTSS